MYLSFSHSKCRDLKPENLLMATQNDDANVKLGKSLFYES